MKYKAVWSNVKHIFLLPGFPQYQKALSNIPIEYIRCLFNDEEWDKWKKNEGKWRLDVLKEVVGDDYYY